MAQEEVALTGYVRAASFSLKGGEGLQHGEGGVLVALGDQAQTKVHGIYREQEGTKSKRCISQSNSLLPVTE